jgi:hypothetical protein
VGRATGEHSAVDQGVFLVHLIRARKSLREGALDAARAEIEQRRWRAPTTRTF